MKVKKNLKNRALFYSTLLGILMTILTSLSYILAAIVDNNLIFIIASIIIALPMFFFWILIHFGIPPLFLVIILISFIIWTLLTYTFYYLVQQLKQKRYRYLIPFIVLMIFLLLMAFWGFVVIMAYSSM